MRNFFISYDDIINSIYYLKDKIIQTPKKFPLYIIKHSIAALITPL